MIFSLLPFIIKYLVQKCNQMDKEIMRERLIDLTKKEIDLVELMNLTIYDVGEK